MNEMKTYLGTRRPGKQPIVVYVDSNNEGHELPTFSDLAFFSRTFDWGSSTAGASQLAFAILFDHFGRNLNKTKIWDQSFKWKAIVPLDSDCWEMNSEKIDLALQEIRENPLCQITR